jgi:drug/metabolite transporter (DMT)-like permease
MERKEFLMLLREILMGAAAGAVGTVALNGTTYADMVIRARPSSSVPAQVASELAGKVGIVLSGEGSDDETAQSRKSGLGALLGIATGLGVGAAYGLARPHLDGVSVPRAAVVLGLMAMAGSDVPSAAMGVTDPTTWGLNAWLSDLIPHLAYGVTTAVAYKAFAGR